MILNGIITLSHFGWNMKRRGERGELGVGRGSVGDNHGKELEAQCAYKRTCKGLDRPDLQGFFPALVSGSSVSAKCLTMSGFRRQCDSTQPSFPHSLLATKPGRGRSDVYHNIFSVARLMQGFHGHAVI